MKRPHWAVIAIAVLSLPLNGWNVVRFWSGGPLASDDEYLMSYERPENWGDEHSECRDRFGFWPDGKRMDAGVLDGYVLPKIGGGIFVVGHDEFWRDLDRGRGIANEPRTPDEAVRDKWAHDVRQKILSCEVAQWLPIVKANAIRRERITFLAVALLPPFLLLTGASLIRGRTRLFRTAEAKIVSRIVTAWRENNDNRWLKVPAHLRRGFLRLYIIVVVPWVMWFGSQLLINGPRWKFFSQTFWTLLALPIGGPILLVAVAWVLAGFQTAGLRHDHPPPLLKPREEPRHAGAAAQQSPHDYYPLISRAVTQLPINTNATRQDLYRRAREALHRQLGGQEPSRTSPEWRSLEQAIRKVEAEGASARRKAQMTSGAEQRQKQKLGP
jgi:hypothetical protein